MLVDARTLPDDALVEADVCIAGAGPAGIVLARELGAAGLRVVLLESGGPDLGAQASDLGQPAVEPGGPAAGPWRTTRCFGGNSNVWSVRTDVSAHGVRLLPLARADFEPREGIADSGWPIARANLSAYYLRAQAACGLPPLGFDPEAWEEPWARQLPGLGEDVRTSMFQFASRDAFVGAPGEALARSAAVLVHQHATAVEIELDADGARVAALRVASAPGREFRVRAAQVVLAAGGLACPQLLLNSDRQRPGGIGNRFDLVGRHYMDHPLVFGGTFVPASRRLFEAAALYDLRTVRGTPVMAHLQLTDAALRREPVLNASAMLFPRVHLSERQRRGVESTRHLWHALRGAPAAGRFDPGAALLGADGVARKLGDKLRARHPHSDLGRGGWSALAGNARRFGTFEVLHQAEQAPHRDNRVRLGRERDRLGSRRIAVDWRWHAEDVAAFGRAQDLFATALRRAGLGEFAPARGADGGPVVLSPSTAHYMGTTRMHADPRRGVVDARCRVHDVGNLFVAGSGVFPTGGFANPTLTTLALAIRLADHLRALHRAARAPVALATEGEAPRRAAATRVPVPAE